MGSSSRWLCDCELLGRLEIDKDRQQREYEMKVKVKNLKSGMIE